MNAAAGCFAAWHGCLRRALAVVALALSPLLAQAQAQIQITPLAEPKHATVTQIGAAELSANDLGPWLDAQMAKAMRDAPFAGAVVVVVKDGNVVLAKGYGYADVAAKRAVDPSATMFRVGGLSKLFLWTAVMQLVEQHKLDLDADVNHYLDFSIPPFDGKPVTLRDLMTQTPGFEDVIGGRFAADASSAMSNDAWVRRWVPTRIYPPGQVPAYSNYGAALAGYIVQRVSGEPFEAYVEKHILAPLGMQHASFRQPLPAPLQADLAQGYTAPGGAPHPFEFITAAPAGALSISGQDMARFMIAHLQFGRAGDAQLLEQSTVQQMQRYQRAAAPGLPGMALGFMRFERNGQELLGHTGDTRYFHSALLLVTGQQAGLFIALDGAGSRGALRPLAAAFVDRYFPPLPQLRQPTLASALTHGAQVVGPYQPSRTSQSNFMVLRHLATESTVSMVADGTLRTPMLDGVVGPAHWREVKPYQWVDDASGSHLFAVMQDGRPRMLATDALLSPPVVYLPVPPGQSSARLLPILYVLLAVFALALLAWPIDALLSRRRNPPPVESATDLRAYRLSRITALFYLLSAGGWYLLLPRLAMGHATLDLQLRLLQLIGLLAVLGTLAVAVHAWCSWRAAGRWSRKIDSVILLLACLGAAWFVLTQHLLSLHLDY